MFAKLESLEERYLELEKELSQPGVMDDIENYKRLAKAHADLDEVVQVFRRHRELARDLLKNCDAIETHLEEAIRPLLEAGR